MLKRFAGLALLLTTASCHRVPSLSEYDRSCTSAADCAPVYIGPLGCCDEPCPNAAVRATVAKRAMSDVEAARMCNVRVPPPCYTEPRAVCPAANVLCN